MGRPLAALAAVLILAGCSHAQSAGDISRSVQQSMQQKFDTDSLFSSYQMHVRGLTFKA